MGRPHCIGVTLSQVHPDHKRARLTKFIVMKYIIGIDPGLNGGMAVIEQDNGSLIHVADTPTAKVQSGKKTKSVHIESEMANLLKAYSTGEAMAAIELVHAMPKQGVVSQFNFGMGFGLWIGMLAALQIPYTKVTPKRWKKHMLDGMGKEKAASCIRAQQLYPSAELFTPRGRALDGRGDALLIAAYHHQTITSQERDIES